MTVKHKIENVAAFIIMKREEGYTLSWNDFLAADVDVPVHLGDGIIVFPPDFDEPRRDAWREENGFELPEEMKARRLAHARPS